jgi:hypothetical protein
MYGTKMMITNGAFFKPVSSLTLLQMKTSIDRKQNYKKKKFTELKILGRDHGLDWLIYKSVLTRHNILEGGS